MLQKLGGGAAAAGGTFPGPLCSKQRGSFGRCPQEHVRVGACGVAAAGRGLGLTRDLGEIGLTSPGMRQGDCNLSHLPLKLSYEREVE